MGMEVGGEMHGGTVAISYTDLQWCCGEGWWSPFPPSSSPLFPPKRIHPFHTFHMASFSFRSSIFHLQGKLKGKTISVAVYSKKKKNKKKSVFNMIRIKMLSEISNTPRREKPGGKGRERQGIRNNEEIPKYEKRIGLGVCKWCKLTPEKRVWDWGVYIIHI